MSPDLGEEREWVLRAAGGDEEAFGRLVKAHGPAAYRVALQVLADPAEAEDAAQDAFLRAWGAMSRFDPDRPFLPWLLKIAARRALTRAARRRSDAPIEAASDVAEPVGLSGPPGAGRMPELEAVREALSRLGAADRALLALRYEQGMSVAELAGALEIGVSAAKVRLFRARERLMALL